MRVAAPLVLIVDQPAPGAVNMRRDLELRDRVLRDGGGGAVRLYGFSPPCLSLGCSQSEDDVDLEACARDGVEVVRRPTGGRAVLHDAEVTYSVTCEVADPLFGGTVAESCGRIHAVVGDALRSLGVATVAAASKGRSSTLAAAARGRSATARNPDCFAEPAAGELLDAAGRKLVGSAQARHAGALLQHGSIPLQPLRTARYLRCASGAGEVIGGLNRVAGRELQRGAVVDALVAAFQRSLAGRTPCSPHLSN